jgi:hypothetical protein
MAEREFTQRDLFAEGEGRTLRPAVRQLRTSVADRLEMVRLCKDEGMAAPEIASRTGFPPATVRYVLRGAGTKPDGRARFTDAEKAEIASRYAAGESSSRLAAEKGGDRSAILYVVRKQGVPVRGPDRSIPADSKRCPHCREVKPRAAGFYLATLADGKVQTSALCRECNSRYRSGPLIREWYKKNREAVRKEAIAAYGGKCSCCGQARWEFLTIDHVRGGGNRHRKALKRKGTDFYVWLRRQGWPTGEYRLLCFNCNLALGFYGHCHGGPPAEPAPPGPDAPKADRVRAYGRLRHRRLRREMVDAYGGRCACCGQDGPQFLALDHAKGGGCAERRVLQVGGLLSRLKRAGWPGDQHRLLCHNCNASVGMLGFCPHTPEATGLARQDGEVPCP